MVLLETDLLLRNLPGLAYRCEPCPPWRMQYVSPGAELLCGFKPEELLNDSVTWGSMIHSEDAEEVDKAVRTAITEDRSFDLIYRINDRRGATMWVHERGQAIRSKPEDPAALVGFIMLVTLRDVTEQSGSDTLIVDKDALQQSAQAELLYRSGQSAMAGMAATLAHELNQPLMAIAMYSAALKRLEAARAGESYQAAEALEANSVRAGEIVKSLRRFAETGRPQLERFLCKELITSSIRFASMDCDDVTIELSFGAEEMVCADRVQIQQVLINLIRNACQAVKSRTDGHVVVATSVVNGARRMLRVCVADNGPGIPQHLLPKIFESGVSTKDDGMGLGLSISRTIVEAHRGRIWADLSKEGGRLSFEIPIDQEASSRSQSRTDRLGT